MRVCFLICISSFRSPRVANCSEHCGVAGFVEACEAADIVAWDSMLVVRPLAIDGKIG